MKTPKPRSKITFLTLLLLCLYLINAVNCDLTETNVKVVEEEEDYDDDDFDQLLALDNEEKQEEHHNNEAQVLSKAQRIVLELNNDNTMKAIEKNVFVLVLGYAPWCPRSAELMPQFAQAATLLKDVVKSDVLLAKLDAERYPKMASTLQIKGFPTLILFANGTAQPYTGGFSAEEIVIWTRKKTGEPVVRISSLAEAEEFVTKYHSFAIGLFEEFEGLAHSEFLKAATSDNEIQFVETSNVEIANVLFPEIGAAKTFFGIVKSEPERYTAFEGAFEKDKILQFLNYNKFPLITQLTDMNAVTVHSSPVKLQVMIFAKPDELKKLIEPLQTVARKFKSKIMFLFIDITNENLAKPFLTLFGLGDSTDIVVAAFDNNNISSKFLLESDPTQANLEEFGSGLLNGNVQPYYKSQSIPDNTDARIRVVVGKSFNEEVLNNPKNVILEVYTPWCINCETMSKQVEKLAKHFKSLDDLVFAKIDASTNEHSKLEVSDYPTLLLYKVDGKANPIKLPTKSSSKDLAKLISKHLKPKSEVSKDEL
ncbi:hypothetical protein ACFE04_008559 [Oxalis oulophora]